MSHNSATLASLVASRLCHDLISPVGAISNGLELLELTGIGTSSPELGLISESCAAARARIGVFRVAFGYASEGQSLGAVEIDRLLAGYCAGSRLTMRSRLDQDQSRAMVQMALLAALCCESALPVGGEIVLEPQGAGVLVAAQGPRLSVDPQLWDSLTNQSATPVQGPASVQFDILRLLANERGCALCVDKSDTRLVVKLG
jgi:histidine phosphotransferase ChpT